MAEGAQGELKELFKKRLEGYVGNTFQIFETKSNLFNLFRKYTPTEESYKNAVKVLVRRNGESCRAGIIDEKFRSSAENEKTKTVT